VSSRSSFQVGGDIIPRPRSRRRAGATSGGGPAAPVLILVSSTSTATFTIDVDNTVGAGDSVRLQTQATGGGWTTLTSDTTHVITPAEDAANQVNLAVGLPTGSYDARALIIHGGVSSSWSNVVINFTIS
jgi:hypothetical protein